MKQFWSFVIKEAKHIFRDKRTMLILFGMPVVLMFIFGFAITTDVKNVRTVVVTSQMSPQTQQAVERLAASEYFDIVSTVATPQEAEKMIRSQKTDMSLTPSPSPKERGVGNTLICGFVDGVFNWCEEEGVRQTSKVFKTFEVCILFYLSLNAVINP